MHSFLLAYNFARRLKTLKGLTPYEYICKIWTKEPERFNVDPFQHTVGLNSKYSYQSHGLRFDVKRQLESSAEFRKRINRQARDEEDRTAIAPVDPDWLLGAQFRHKGSIHKDIWCGKAIELAERGQIAVYPAMGWWRTRTVLERFDKEARYALIVAIAVPGVDVDLPIKQVVGI